MTKVRVTNKLPSFQKSLYRALDDGIREAARDTLIVAKNRAPFDRGGLRSASLTQMIAPLWQRVSFWEEYARFQEFGGTPERRVRHYSTAGTGKHYLKSAGDGQIRKLTGTLKKHAARARA